jgi:hypothetical protein
MRARTLSIGLLALFLGGCGGSTAKSDGGVDHSTSSLLLMGTIDPGAPPICLTQPLLLVGGQAQCTVTQHLAGASGVTSTTLPSCFAVNQGPCWSLVTSPASCPGGGLTFTFDPDPANPDPTPGSLTYDYSCALSD